jgi:hypothetical protein
MSSCNRRSIAFVGVGDDLGGMHGLRVAAFTYRRSPASASSSPVHQQKLHSQIRNDGIERRCHAVKRALDQLWKNTFRKVNFSELDTGTDCTVSIL